MLAISLHFESPLAAALALLCLTAAVVIWRRWRERGMSVGALSIAIATLCLLIAGPSLRFPGQRDPLVILIDISASFRDSVSDAEWAAIRQQIGSVVASDGRPSISLFIDTAPRLGITATPGEATITAPTLHLLPIT